MTANALALLDRARRNLSFGDLCRFVGPSDPGWIDYLGQMSAIREVGAAALESSIDWEPLSCALWDDGPANPRAFLWYRLMAAAAALACDDDMLMMSAHGYLGHALRDTIVLRDIGDPQAPVDLLGGVCRELALAEGAHAEVRLFAMLGALVATTFETPESETIASLCERVENAEQRLCTQGDYVGEEYVWGLTRFDTHHPVWMWMIGEHWPSHVPEAAALSESLLEHGARWGAAEPVPLLEGPFPVERGFSAEAIAFFLGRARAPRSRDVALRLAEAVFENDDEAVSEGRVSAMNNAIHGAHADGRFELAARWADVARTHARDNGYLPHNLACAYAAVGRMDDAFEMCLLAVDSEETDLEALRNDEDLGLLRSQRRFRRLFRR